ncbi:MAG: polynucleotide adenylyltransferase PcnB [Gammaproteobacteria bacterium]
MDESTSLRQQQPLVIPRADHTVSRSNISSGALKVLYRLHNAGYRACLVGGGVRDILLGREPKDFDVGTNATPEEIRKLFRNCRLIGRRFRLAHVQFGGEIIEVATFRALNGPDPGLEPEDSDDSAPVEAGLIRSDNVYGTIEEDAQRRDFTVNALYYDIADFSLLDYAGGLDDLQTGIIRVIGDPEVRYREDPVRMLRAVRFAAKLGFRLHPDTEAPIHKLAHLLRQVPSARLFDEILKLFISGYATQTFELLRLYGLFRHLMPLTERCLRKLQAGFPRTLLIRALNNTDQRVLENKPVTPAFLYAALLWAPLCDRIEILKERGLSPQEALHQAADELIEQQNKHTSLPRRFSVPMREIWALQNRFERRSGKRAMAFLTHPRFRAAYDFMLLRAEAGEPVAELAQWWSEVQTLPEAEQANAFSAPKDPSRRRPRKRRPASSSTH